jgi:hypothetical protein
MKHIACRAAEPQGDDRRRNRRIRSLWLAQKFLAPARLYIKHIKGLSVSLQDLRNAKKSFAIKLRAKPHFFIEPISKTGETERKIQGQGLRHQKTRFA